MIRFIMEKLLQKKWMILSLLTGMILFVSIACLSPMYLHGALQKMLSDRIRQSAISLGQSPLCSAAEKTMNIQKTSFEEASEKGRAEMEAERQKLDLPIRQETVLYLGNAKTYKGDKHAEDGSIHRIAFAAIDGLEEHINLVDGELYKESVQSDGVLTCIVSQSAYNKEELVIGEIMTFEGMKDAQGGQLKCRVVGVFEQSDPEDVFWAKRADEFDAQCFVSMKCFGEDVCLALADSDSNKDIWVTMQSWISYDYESLKYENIPALMQTFEAWEEKGITNTSQAVISEYQEDTSRIETIMGILQLPTMALLALFIFMVASKMTAMEQGEIAMLKSRGVSGLQIVFVYFMQGVIITLIADGFGLLLGALLAQMIGMSESFMEFIGREPLHIELTARVWLYLFAASAFGTMVMTLPVIPRCKATIVEQKQKRKKHKQVFWKRMYLDVIGLAVSIYSYYSYNTQLASLAERVQAGEKVDPVLFLGSSLFILSASLFMTRVIPFAAYLIYRIGKKKWSVTCYTAFLQTIRNKDKQSFIMIFLGCTVALGIFNANTARTINANEEINIRYVDGADLVLEERFENNLASVKYRLNNGFEAGDVVYTDIDSYKYNTILQHIESMTTVTVTDDIIVKEPVHQKLELELGDCTLMGIQTKAFGETAYMPQGITQEHWYSYLNALAQNPNGLLVSSNARNQFGLEIGDSLTYTHFDALKRADGLGRGEIVGFVDYFPGYENRELVYNADGSYESEPRYLIVASFDMVRNYLGLLPYQRWIKNVDSNAYIYDFTTQNNVQYTQFHDAENDVIEVKNNPMFQETNGLLTIGFLAALFVCAIGFLIFQIMGIKERELMFGVYRAMGLTKKEMRGMLVMEQLLSSLPAMLFGALIGMVATVLYVPLIEVTYVSKIARVLPTSIVCNPKDMLQLVTILAVAFITCMVIVVKSVAKMKIAQALKLGEE